MKAPVSTPPLTPPPIANQCLSLTRRSPHQNFFNHECHEFTRMDRRNPIRAIREIRGPSFLPDSTWHVARQSEDIVANRIVFRSSGYNTTPGSRPRVRNSSRQPVPPPTRTPTAFHPHSQGLADFRRPTPGNLPHTPQPGTGLYKPPSRDCRWGRLHPVPF